MNNPFESIEARLNGIEDLILDLKHGSLKKDKAKEANADLLTREETCELLKINSSTLWAWTKKGKVSGYGIGNRRYYKRSELMDALILLKK